MRMEPTASLLLAEPITASPVRWIVALTAAILVAFVFFLMIVQGRIRADRAVPIAVELGYTELPLQDSKPAPQPRRALPPPPPTPVPIEESTAPAVPGDIVLPASENVDVTAAPPVVSPPLEHSAPQVGPLRLEPGVQLDNAEFTPVFTPKPAYPPLARSEGIEGFVDVDLLISEQGRVERFSILSISGHPAFGNEVAKVISRWRFPPPRHGGRNVKVKYLYRVKFEME